MDLTWNVYIEDFNKREIEAYNIFNHRGFCNDLDSKFKNTELSKEDFSEQLRRILAYYFWSKAEWETVLTSWPAYVTPKEITRLNNEVGEYVLKWGSEPRVINVKLNTGSKIDVYDQVRLNWDIFVDYVWNYYYESK